MKDTEVKRLLYQDSEAFKSGCIVGKIETIGKAAVWLLSNGLDSFQVELFKKAMLEE